MEIHHIIGLHKTRSRNLARIWESTLYFHKNYPKHGCGDLHRFTEKLIWWSACNFCRGYGLKYKVFAAKSFLLKIEIQTLSTYLSLSTQSCEFAGKNNVNSGRQNLRLFQCFLSSIYILTAMLGSRWFQEMTSPTYCSVLIKTSIRRIQFQVFWMVWLSYLPWIRDTCFVEEIQVCECQEHGEYKVMLVWVEQVQQREDVEDVYYVSHQHQDPEHRLHHNIPDKASKITDRIYFCVVSFFYHFIELFLPKKGKHKKYILLLHLNLCSKVHRRFESVLILFNYFLERQKQIPKMSQNKVLQRQDTVYCDSGSTTE